MWLVYSPRKFNPFLNLSRKRFRSTEVFFYQGFFFNFFYVSYHSKYDIVITKQYFHSGSLKWVTWKLHLKIGAFKEWKNQLSLISGKCDLRRISRDFFLGRKSVFFLIAAEHGLFSVHFQGLFEWNNVDNDARSLLKI